MYWIVTYITINTSLMYLVNDGPQGCYLLKWVYIKGPSWSWLYGSWSNNYLCNQCLSSLMLWVRTPLRRGVLDTTLW